MGDEAKRVRLVRCPKCENLLPELPEYSVYKCGACDTLLRAKKKVPLNDGFMEKSEEEKSRGSFEKLDYLSERGGNSLGSASGSERESPIDVRVFGERRANYTRGFSRTTKKKEAFDENESKNGEEEIKGLRFKQNGRYDLDVNSNSSNNVSPSLERDINNSNGPFVDCWRVDKDGSRGVYGNSREVAHQERIPIIYHDNGPSSDSSNLLYGHSEHIGNHEDLDGPKTVESLEYDRAELLKKLDQLNDRLSRSSDVEDKRRGLTHRASRDLYGDHVNYNVRHPPVQNNQHVQMPPYFSPIYASMNHQNMMIQNIYPPPRHVQDNIPTYENPFQPQMTGRFHYHYQPSHQYPPRAPHEGFLGRDMDFNQDPLASNARETFLHQPACPCVHCSNTRVPPIPFSNRKIPEVPRNSNLYHNGNPVTFGAPSFHPGGMYPSPNKDKLPSTRRQSDPDSEIDGFSQIPQSRAVVSQRNLRFCHALAGGAPFIICYNCFELLKLPRKILKVEKNQRKLNCGACSAVILIEIENRKLVIRVPEKTRLISAEINEEFDNSGYKLSDMTHDILSEEEGLNLIESETKKTLSPRSSISSEEERSPARDIVPENSHNTSELPSKETSSPTHHHSPSEEHSAEDVPAETELDVSSSYEYSNTHISQESIESRGKEDQGRTKKSGQSFFVGLIKKSFKDLSRSKNGRPNVFINGNPIPDRMVKTAEKLAGPILPGDYWYDFRAGFWGLMGHPSLGIIPPYIEEFNFPMPSNCGAGNTGVYVNGRELHNEDLDLLSGRGLPTTKDKFYSIDVSGKVLDEDSGEEIVIHLGKLAPTIEKAKHGFGMKVPRRLM